MGWSVYVADIVCYRATCNEFDCLWTGPIRHVRDMAALDATNHARDHTERWEAINREWEDTDA